MLADNLRAELRAVDTAARFGGDEFVIILPQANSEGAMLVAERLRKRISEIDVPYFGQVTASLGVATFPVHASSRDTLVVAVDRALYSSKNSGRNRVSLPAEETCEIPIPSTVTPSTVTKPPEVDLIDALQRLYFLAIGLCSPVFIHCSLTVGIPFWRPDTKSRIITLHRLAEGCEASRCFCAWTIYE